jgi:hypothetical protein
MAWGDNSFNQLGVSTGANNNSDVPVKVTGVSHATGVAGGRRGWLGSLALLSTGRSNHGVTTGLDSSATARPTTPPRRLRFPVSPG